MGEALKIGRAFCRSRDGSPLRRAEAFPLLPDVDQLMERIEAHLSDAGALGLMLVDARELRKIEARYGGDAHARALDRVTDLVRERVLRSVDAGEALVSAERGGDAILAFLFRPRGDAAFYCGAMAELAEQIREELASQGRRAVYPYYRDPLALPMGRQILLRNPNLRTDRQLRRAAQAAWRDAGFEAQLEARRRGRELLDLILGDRIGVRYEPIVELRTGEVVGHEALARGPQEALLSRPHELFAQAAADGLSFELDRMCRRVALEQSRSLPEGSMLFLNCLPSSIGDPNLRGEGLRKSLESHQLDPSRLVLEISEQESIENFEIFRERVNAWHELGIRIAVDDAGAGYASLEAIMEITPDFLKADMQLVRGIDTDPPRQEVLRALNSVAIRIGAQLIAEGVETEEERAALRELGVIYGQGFLFGKPG